MDREIKFRVWEPQAKEMIYQEDSNFIIDNELNTIITADPEGYAHRYADSEICMQWSGLKLDDQDIYEGDLLRLHVRFKENCYPLLYVVKFFNGTFVCELLDKYLDHQIYRIIGIPEKLNLYKFIHRTFLFLGKGVTLTIEKVILEGNIFENKELLNSNQEDK